MDKIESKIVKRELKWKGDWIYVELVDFTVGSHVIKNYESCSRIKKNPQNKIDGISIIPIIKSEKQQTKQLLLIAQFRPPVGRFVLEVPAGISEGNTSKASDIWDDVQRELKEETGFTAKRMISKLDSLPFSIGDPSILNSSGYLIVVEIDADAPENQVVKQDLEQSGTFQIILIQLENIVVHMVDINDQLFENVIKIAKDNNYLMIDKVMGLITGFQLALNI